MTLEIQEAQTFKEWLTSNNGNTNEIGIAAILTDKLRESVHCKRAISIMMTQMCDEVAEKLYRDGYVSDRVHLEKERDACLRATEIYMISGGHFEGEFPNYMSTCFEMWNASAHLRRMNPFQFTRHWIRVKLHRVRGTLLDWWDAVKEVLDG